MLMKRRKGPIILFVIAILIIIVAGGYLAKEYMVREHAQDAYTEISEDFTGLESVDYPAVGEMPEEDFSFVLIDGKLPVDFQRLQQINEDLFAWIKIPNTQIDYPIACYEGEDQNYYLNHNMYREEQFAGCIFMQNVNEKDFSEYNTVLYGHNMKNDSMFGELHDFSDREFFDENRYIYIYLPDRVNVYEVFAAYTTNDININAIYDFSKRSHYEQYIKDIYGSLAVGGHIAESVEVTTDKSMITLSTCSSQDEDRYVVQGVLKAVVEASASLED